MAMKPRILVVGAGIGGLTAALALLRRGFDVRIFERADELKEAGAGLHCSPNGARVLIALGLHDAIERVAVRTQDRDVRLWNTGQRWPIANHGANANQRYGAPYYMMHRGDLHAMLVNAVRTLSPDAIRLRAHCVDFAQDGASVELVLDTGERVRGDALIGADGVKSTIRHILFGDGNPSFTGLVAWRGLIAMERLPERMRGSISSNWMGPGGSVTVYPVHKGELLNFVALVQRDDWQVESWTEQGSREDCAADLRGWHADIQEMIRQIDIPYRWGLFLRAPLRRWTVGRVSLLGDACHPMLPFLGQGANMAIEDAMVLVRCLDGEPDVAAALRRYELARVERTALVVERSAEQGKRVRRPELADPATAVGYIEKQWSQNTMAQWYDWIFEYDATAVPLPDDAVLNAERIGQ